MLTLENYKLEPNLDGLFDEPFDDISCSSTTYTTSIREITSSTEELDEDIKDPIFIDEEDFDDDEANIFLRVYEKAEEFLDEEDLYIIAPSPVVKSTKLKVKSVTNIEDMIVMRRKTSEETQNKTDKSEDFSFSSLIARRKKLLRRLTV